MSFRSTPVSQTGIGLQGSVTCPRSHFKPWLLPPEPAVPPCSATSSALKADMRGGGGRARLHLLPGVPVAWGRGAGMMSKTEKERGCANTSGATSRMGLDLDKPEASSWSHRPTGYPPSLRTCCHGNRSSMSSWTESSTENLHCCMNRAPTRACGRHNQLGV